MEAVLAGAGDPITRQLALKWAGVDIERLGADERRSIDEVFARWRFDSPSATEPLFLVPQDSQPQVFTRLRLEIDSVHERIVQSGLGLFGIDLPGGPRSG